MTKAFASAGRIPHPAHPPRSLPLHYLPLPLPLLLPLLLLFASLLPSLTSALYEDQFGQFDWHRPHIGHIQHLHFHPSSNPSTPPSLLLASSHSLVASLTPSSTSHFNWRTPLTPGEVVTSSLLTPTSLLLLSHPHGTVRSLSPSTGALQWESSTPSLTLPTLTDTLRVQRAGGDYAGDVANASSVLAVLPFEGGVRVVAGYGGDVRAYVGGAAGEGEEEWTWSSHGRVVGLTVTPLLVHVASIRPSTPSVLTLTALHVGSGEVAFTSSVDAPSAGPLSSSHVHCHRAGFIVVLTSPSTLVAVTPTTSSYVKATVDTSALLPEAYRGETGFRIDEGVEFTSAFVLSSKASHHIIVHSPSTPSSPLSHVKAVPGQMRLIAPSPSPLHSASSSLPLHYVAVHVNFPPNKPELVLNVYSTASDEPLYSVYRPSWTHGRVEGAWLQVEGGKEGGRVRSRVLLVSEELMVGYVEDAEWKWERDESLSSITELVWADLPSDATINTGRSHHYPLLPQRIGQQVKGAVKWVNDLVRTDWLAAFNSRKSRAPTGKHTGPVYVDKFGLRKLVIAATSVGRVVAFDSESGREVWSARIPSPGDDIWRILTVSPTLLLVITRGPAGYTVYDVDPLTGSIHSHRVVARHLESVVVTRHQTEHEQHIVLLTDGAAVYVHPPTAEALALLHPHLHSLFYHYVDLTSNTITGYALSSSLPTPTQSTSTSLSPSLRAIETFEVSFPASESIAALAPSHPFHTVQSSVRLVGGGGDGGLLYKYLNPNLLVFATERKGGEGGGQSTPPLVPSVKKSTDPSITVYLLDTVSGVVLERWVHRGCAGPVQVVQSENVLVYQYFHLTTLQWEVSVVELYEARDGDSPLTLMSAIQAVSSTPTPLSSFTAPSPFSLQQSYITNTRFTSLSTTTTLRGITSMEVLALLPTGQVVALPKAVLDPRRPVGEPSAGDKAEGLFPYSGELIWGGREVVTANVTVMRGRGIATVGVMLESVSDVCVWGVDVWCGRRSPSATFDLLNEDFNYPALLLTVTAIVAAIGATRHFARNKELQAAWK